MKFNFLNLTFLNLIQINDCINCPKAIEVNGRIIDTNVKDKQTGYNWPNSYGLCYQFEEARKCIMNNKLTSDLHTAENSILLTDTIAKVISEVGSEVSVEHTWCSLEYYSE